MPPRKEPKETVTYPASKRKAPPFKPQRPIKAPKVAEDEAVAKPAKARKSPEVRKLYKAASKKVYLSETPAKIGTSKQLKRAAGRRVNERIRASGDEDGSEDDEVLVTSARKKSVATKKPAKELSPLDSDSDDEVVVTSKKKIQATKKKPSRELSPLDSKSEDEPAFEPATKPPAKHKPSRDLSPLSDLSPQPEEQAAHIESPVQDAPPPLSQSEGIGIPQPLLIRLLHESFQSKQTTIDKQAIQVLQKYFEVFIREALARASMQKQEDAAERGVLVPRGGVDDGWLELEDLERVAGEMLLDF